MIPWLLWSVLALAVAQEPAPADDAGAPEGPTEGFAEEEADLIIDVVSQVEVLAARDAVVRALKELGWKPRRREGDVIVFRGPEGWMGKARLYATGDIVFSTPVLAFGGAREAGGAGDDNLSRSFDNDMQSGTVGVSVTPMPSPKKVRGVQEEIRAAVQPLVLEYREMISKERFSSYVGELPSRLDALWERGEPLMGLDVVDGVAARRAEVLSFWASRLDTPEGIVVSRIVEGWLRNVVQSSDAPVTAEERAAAEARREDGRRLDL